MLRVIRNHRRAAHGEATATRACTSRRSRSTTPPARKAIWWRRLARLGPRARARRAARLPQRPGHGHRAHRHDRPRHGLRHHRHRARLRAGEVQEARRRRLLQDHQPVRAGGAAGSRLHARRRSRRSSATRSATARSTGAPGVNHAALKAKGFTDEMLGGRGAGARQRLRHQFVFNKWTLGEEFLHRDPRVRGGRSSPTRASTCLPRSASRRPRSRQANTYVCGAMTLEGAPHLKDEHLAGLRLRQPLRPHRQALPLGRQPHPHDGRRPALHLGRHLQDHQHAERGDGRGVQGSLHAVLEAGAEGQRALPRRLEALPAAQLAASS